MDNVRLLILDDDPNIGRAIQLVAESAGAAARFLTQTEDFFRCIGEWHPTHVAIDLVMPEMDGVEVLVKLAELKSEARIIITSGLSIRVLDAARRSGYEQGLNIAGVLSKPFSPPALLALLMDTPAAEQDESSGQSSVVAPTDSFEVTEQELKQAFASRDLHLAYQPQIECLSGHLVGFEALVRWMHPRRGIIMPDQFIPFAESHRLIDELTDQVLEQAIAWIVSAFPRMDLTVAINLSARSAPAQRPQTATVLADTPLMKRIKMLCHTYGFDPSKLILELTETSAMEDPVSSLAFLTRLRMHSVQLSIDDFGTGYSSMVQLVRLPFSEIKVDKSFVGTAMRSLESRAVVKSIVDLGHSLELRVVAEGVEDAATLGYLQEIGCDLAQGYFIGRPMSGDAALAWTASRGDAVAQIG